MGWIQSGWAQDVLWQTGEAFVLAWVTLVAVMFGWYASGRVSAAWKLNKCRKLQSDEKETSPHLP